MDDLVSTEWLAAHLGEPGLVVLDATAHVLDPSRDAHAEYLAAHIPGARFLDLGSLTDRHSEVPAALPNAEQFAARMAELGIGDASRIILYDDTPAHTSARAWFMTRLHGAGAAILDGGLGKWRAEGRPLETGESTASLGGFAARPGVSVVRFKADMLANLSTQAEQVVDARGAGRFSGTEPEPRPGMASGHIPGSLNLPYGQVLDSDGTFKDAHGIQAAFESAGVDLARPVVTTCGSGVTAAVLLFALHLIGKDDVALYDGSWSEWGGDRATPKATAVAV
jgi:thiosulfate/3-mercaptopyruvate sulfurtransferase